MSRPPKYPRVPHVAAGPAASGDDDVLSDADRHSLLASEVVVEEKLDGQNLAVWCDAGVPQVATRGGANTMDRSGERGRVRAWAAERHELLAAALGERYVVYVEWLRRRHAVAYETLPSPAIGLDVLDQDSGRFLPVARRNALLADIGIPAPPQRARGRFTLAQLDALLGTSALGDARAEGLVIRRLGDGEPRLAKLVDPAYSGIGQHGWHGENRVRPAA